MDVKAKAKKTYNDSADLWHQSRRATLSGSDLKLIKQNRPHLFIEKPAMYSKVPELKGKVVLCLGCGSGEECGFLLTKKPQKIVGVDISKNLIEIAKKVYPQVEFFVMDAERLGFKDKEFDFIYSSLLLDYFKSWKKVLSEIHRVLKDDGVFLFSNIHPVKWAARKIDDADGKAIGCLLGYNLNPDTNQQEIYGDYLNTVLHREVWMKKMEVYYYTKPVSLMFKEIYQSGFFVADILEPKAVLETKKYDLDYWRVNQKIPNFVIFECRKRL